MELKDQILNITSNLLTGLMGSFMNIFYALLVLFILILIYDFLRIKFLNKDIKEAWSYFVKLIGLMGKLFVATGIGFVIANVIALWLTFITRSGNPSWHNLAFGIMLLFMGIGFIRGHKQLRKEENSN